MSKEINSIHMKKKFDRSLGTSKRDQGITTPKDQNAKKAAEGKRHAFKYMMKKSGLMSIKRGKPETKTEALKRKVTGTLNKPVQAIKRAAKALKHAAE